MPGYGYAAAPKDKVQAWTQLIHEYLRGRANLARVYVLIDARHGLKDADQPALDALSKAAVSHQIVLTKADQVKAAELTERIAATEAALKKRPAAFPPCCRPRRAAATGIPELRAAIARLKAERSMNSGLEGVIAADTVLSHVDGNDGTIWVRGHTVDDLVKNHGFEGTVAIIWEGFAGEGLTRAKIQSEFGKARERAFARMNDWLETAAKRPLLEGVRIALAAMPEDSTPAEIATTLPVAISALVRTREGQTPIGPDGSLATAADFLRMLKGRPAPANDIRALDTYFTTVCENGLGNSSFAARVTVSTKASLASAIVSAYSAFTGPLHGGAPGPVLDMLDEIKASGDTDGWIEKKLAAGERLMGFGHRVFRIRDPRADVLRAAVALLNKDAGRLAFASEVETVALAALARHKPGRSLQSNIEMNAALLLDAVGVPRDAFTQVFAMTRCAGWIANALEQRKTGRMIRPASNYVGPRPA